MLSQGCQQETVFPAALINVIDEVAVKWHQLYLPGKGSEIKPHEKTGYQPTWSGELHMVRPRSSTHMIMQAPHGQAVYRPDHVGIQVNSFFIMAICPK
jgi:hypothetical protein